MRSNIQSYRYATCMLGFRRMLYQIMQRTLRYTITSNSYAIDAPWPCCECDVDMLRLAKSGVDDVRVASVWLGIGLLTQRWIYAIMPTQMLMTTVGEMVRTASDRVPLWIC